MNYNPLDHMDFYEPPRWPNFWIFLAGVLIITILLCLVFWESARADTASWYDYQSCRKEGTSGIWTASGEQFNTQDLTAAMWGVPFNTHVKVTNLANGKEIIVRINDRGPSKKLVRKGRVIDLSKRAFYILSGGHLEQGVIKVKVRILKGGN